MKLQIIETELFSEDDIFIDYFLQYLPGKTSYFVILETIMGFVMEKDGYP
jgi:hypothetical protein